MSLRKKKQRAVITLTDTDNGGFKAHVVYEPSVFNKDGSKRWEKPEDIPPCINVAVRLALIIKANSEHIHAPLIESKIIKPESKIILPS